MVSRRHESGYILITSKNAEKLWNIYHICKVFRQYECEGAVSVCKYERMTWDN